MGNDVQHMVSDHTLHLGNSPRSVQEARGWAADTCARLGRDDLVESARLGVSELVTNALLHGAPPVSVRVGGTPIHPRFEVFDASPVPPVPPLPRVEADHHDVDNLGTFGRGLNLVAQVASAWGATRHEHGKLVWFEPTPEFHSDPSGASIFEPAPQGEVDPSAQVHTVLLSGIPLTILAGLQQQYLDLRRELHLLALSHGDSYPLANQLVQTYATFEAHFVSIGSFPVEHQGSDATDLPFGVLVTPTTHTLFETMREMLDLADEFCRAQRLLTVARTPAQARLQHWIIEEILNQLCGEGPRPWASERGPAESVG